MGGCCRAGSGVPPRGGPEERVSGGSVPLLEAPLTLLLLWSGTGRLVGAPRTCEVKEDGEAGRRPGDRRRGPHPGRGTMLHSG